MQRVDLAGARQIQTQRDKFDQRLRVRRESHPRTQNRTLTPAPTQTAIPTPQLHPPSTMGDVYLRPPIVLHPMKGVSNEITKITILNVENCEFCEEEDPCFQSLISLSSQTNSSAGKFTWRRSRMRYDQAPQPGGWRLLPCLAIGELERAASCSSWRLLVPARDFECCR